ncbi:MAG: ribosomal protein S18-alanine N-acetyltransferase [Acetobacter sp.]|nr:ribosomal protein S18-alanine N-acetyltransferase [Bacteroides sp.]MCM1341203.1 ribosomal protein S18-alanine N-acetyltransferase [Acetobacter sp.]MCM1433846.1 ribosomal protein S18-alanine N-acetyltransferase [Clostridiales bacterium]
MTIEKMSEKYIDNVYEIEKICFSNPWSREDLRKQLDISTSHFIVAVSDNKAVGYMGLQIFSGEGYVTNVAVLPEYRGQGIAKELIAEQLKNEMTFITLEVRESNIPAIKLYVKMGFENMGIRPKFYSSPTENAVIMTRYMI